MSAAHERERLLRRLSSLLEASVALHSYNSIEETLAACASAGLSLLGGDGADTSWVYQGQRSVGGAGRARAVGDHVCRVALPRLRREVEGELSVYRKSAPFDALDQLSIAWLAQAAVVALDNTQLLRSSERATQMREDILAIVAHDLRSPVAVVVAAADELRQTMPEAARTAGQILRAATRMVRMLDDLLDAAQIDAGTLRVTPQLQPLGKLLEEAAAGVDAHRTVKFPTLPAELKVWADKDRILQVFSNLIGNAIKFTPPEGDVAVEVEAAPQRVVIRVRDTGPGVPAEQRSRLFERYWSGKAQPGSAGLGLYIARAIVAAHGGQLELEDSKRGATFRFDLPRAPPGPA